MHPAVSTTISVCFRGRGWGERKNEIGREMSTGPFSAVCIIIFLSLHLPLSTPPFPHWYSRSLWILRGTSMQRRTLRPMKTQWTPQMSCHCSLWRRRRCKAWHNTGSATYLKQVWMGVMCTGWKMSPRPKQSEVLYLALITITDQQNESTEMSKT